MIVLCDYLLYVQPDLIAVRRQWYVLYLSFMSVQTTPLYRLPISNYVYECTEVNHNVIKIIIRIEYHIIHSYVTLYATKVLSYFYFFACDIIYLGRYDNYMETSLFMTLLLIIVTTN